MLRLAFCCLLAVLASSKLQAEPRQWADRSGKFNVEAEYAGYADGKVSLLRADGTTIMVPLSNLSPKDQEFVRLEIKAARAKEPKEPKDPKETKETKTAKAAPGIAATPVAAVAGWPQWRGPGRDGISQEKGLLKSWPDGGPPLLWSAKGLGRGWSSVAVTGGMIYTMGNRRGQEQIIALKEDGGGEAWSAQVGRGDHSNGTPTVDGDIVYAVGLQGDLVAVNAKTGEEVWRTNYEKDFGGKMMSGWGFSESPLIDGDRLICTPGANNAIMAALDKKTGKLIWKAALPADTGRRGGEGSGSASITYADGHLYFRYQNGVMVLIEANPREYKLKGRFQIKTRHSESWSAPVVAGGKLYLRDEDELHCYDITAN